MYNAVLLASALATPPESQGRETFERYLRRLLDWTPLRETGLTRPLCSYETINALFESGAYPFTPHIRAAIDKFGLREFSVQDIATIADFLLARSDRLEEATGIKDLLFSSFNCEPELKTPNDTTEIENDNARTLSLLATWVSLSGQSETDQICIHPQSIEPLKTHINTIIEDIDSTQLELRKKPLNIDMKIWSASDFASTVRCLDETAFWRGSQTLDQAQLAVRLAYYKDAFKCGSNPIWEELPSLAIRQELIDSAERFGFKHDQPKIIRLFSAMVDAIAGRNLQNTHALRTTKGGNAPQVRRGNDKAFRWDIDNEFHLHYWATATNGLEFASVVTHNDFSIPE